MNRLDVMIHKCGVQVFCLCLCSYLKPNVFLLFFSKSIKALQCQQKFCGGQWRNVWKIICRLTGNHYLLSVCPFWKVVKKLSTKGDENLIQAVRGIV